MAVFQDLLTDEYYETHELGQTLSLHVGNTPFCPTRLRVSLRYTPSEIRELSLEVILDRASEVEVLAPHLQAAGHSSDEIKALIFSQTAEVALHWQAKPEVLQAYQQYLLPLQPLQKLWDFVAPESGSQLFLDLDQGYFFHKLELRGR